MNGGSLTVLGIDPGLTATGYGIVVGRPHDYRAVDHGVIRPPPASRPLAERLLAIEEALRKVLHLHRPDVVAIEEPFFGENARSALALGRAQAAAMLAAARLGIAVHTYAPADVKAAVAGYGRGDKRQVAEMVRLQLGMPAIPEPADAADALAVALCHATRASSPLAGTAR